MSDDWADILAVFVFLVLCPALACLLGAVLALVLA